MSTYSPQNSSGYEHFNRCIGICKNWQKSYDEKITYALTPPDVESKKIYLEYVLNNMQYEDLSVFFKHIDSLRKIFIDYELKSYLKNDFGFALRDMEDSTLKALKQAYKNNTEKQFYKKLIKSLNPDIYINDSINYDEMYRVLNFVCRSHSAPFLKSHSAEYTMPFVRVLELEHNTRLGYPRKFNNYFDIQHEEFCKRAEAWADYLIKQGLITAPDDDDSPTSDE